MTLRFPPALGLAGAVACGSVVPITKGDAAVFASAIVDYTPGSGTTLTDPSAALGAPAPVVGAGSGFDAILSPFSPHYEANQIVQIGEGGSLTLRLAHEILLEPGLPEIGIFANVGIADADWPNGVAGGDLSADPATFGVDFAQLAVSDDGREWRDLGRFRLDQPTNFYADLPTPGSLDTDGLTPADFGQSHGNELADFAGKDWIGIKAVLAGSAGGTWIDLDPSGLRSPSWLRIDVPDDGDPATALSVEIDAVSIENRALGAPVPEPSAVLLVGLGLLLTTQRCRTR